MAISHLIGDDYSDWQAHHVDIDNDFLHVQVSEY